MKGRGLSLVNGGLPLLENSIFKKEFSTKIRTNPTEGSTKKKKKKNFRVGEEVNLGNGRLPLCYNKVLKHFKSKIKKFKPLTLSYHNRFKTPVSFIFKGGGDPATGWGTLSFSHLHRWWNSLFHYTLPTDPELSVFPYYYVKRQISSNI